MRKRQIWVTEPYFGEVRGDARPWLVARWKAYGQCSISYFNSFSLSYGSEIMRRNVYSSAVFADRPPCTQILPRQGRPPATILGIRKLEALSYTIVKIASLCVLSF